MAQRGQQRQKELGPGARLILGALAGLTGAACMDAVRFTARRARLIDRRIPEEVTRRVARRLGLSRHRAPTDVSIARDAVIARDAIMERTLHLGYGATLAAVFAAVAPRASPGKGVAFGLATWVLGSGLVLPALRVRYPFWKASASENAVDVAAHVLFGVVTTLGLTELEVAAGGDRAGQIG